jgi:tRNA-dihydrouridine synthase A
MSASASPAYARARACSAGDVLSVAPMMGWTDRHYRFMLRLLSRRTRVYTEMFVANTLLFSPQARAMLRFSAAESPVACQLGGSDPGALARAARLVEEAGYDEINLNCGCPSPRVAGKGAFGARLMFSPETVRECVSAMRAAVRVPVTVKCRLGADGMNSYEEFAHFISVVAQSGATHFIVHARHCVLNGLDPKGNRTVPPLMYPWVQRVALERPDLRISINGGLVDWVQVEQLLSLARDGAPLDFSADDEEEAAAAAAAAAMSAAAASAGARSDDRGAAAGDVVNGTLATAGDSGEGGAGCAQGFREEGAGVAGAVRVEGGGEGGGDGESECKAGGVGGWDACNDCGSDAESGVAGAAAAATAAADGQTAASPASPLFSETAASPASPLLSGSEEAGGGGSSPSAPPPPRGSRAAHDAAVGRLRARQFFVEGVRAGDGLPRAGGGGFSGSAAVIDSVMVGRAAYNNPWMFADADVRFFGERENPAASRRAVLSAYLDYADALVASLDDDERGALLYRPFEFAKPLLALFQGEYAGSRFRKELSKGLQERGLSLRDAVAAALVFVPEDVVDAPPGNARAVGGAAL